MKLFIALLIVCLLASIMGVPLSILTGLRRDINHGEHALSHGSNHGRTVIHSGHGSIPSGYGSISSGYGSFNDARGSHGNGYDDIHGVPATVHRGQGIGFVQPVYIRDEIY